MYLLIGLGNPEPDYARTRHNMGFDVINKIAQKYDIELSKTKFNAICGTGMIEGKKVILIKPQTYMNLSGGAVKQYVDFYKVLLEDILVVYDDMDTEVGKIRIRSKGGAGSHNGMKSMIKELDSEDFSRIRVGIGKPKNEYDRIDYVIGHISDEEYIELQKGQNSAVEAMECFLEKGIDIAMNLYNVKDENTNIRKEKT